jgi:hypothetical protein
VVFSPALLDRQAFCEGVARKLTQFLLEAGPFQKKLVEVPLGGLRSPG